MLKGLGAGGTAWQRGESPGLGCFPPGDTEQVFMAYRGQCVFFPGEPHPWKRSALSSTKHCLNKQYPTIIFSFEINSFRP